MSSPVIYFDLGDTLVYGPPGDRQPFDDAVSTIEELWHRGYQIGLLSDQNPGTTVEDLRDKLTDYGLEAHRFDAITISSEFVPPIYKPDPQIFEAALSKAGHASASSNTIFVTENLSHIAAARDLGWRAIHKPYATGCTTVSGECVEDLDELLALFPPLEIDLYVRDAPHDPGSDDFTGSVFWNSPDLWIRHAEDDGTSHQSPEAGRDNWFYTRVHNRGDGIARTYSVGYSVQEWAGTQFVYPGDYWPFLAFTSGVNLQPGESAVVHTRWRSEDVPPAGTHACWLAAVQADDDLPTAGSHVWENNNLAQKNLAIVDADPGEDGEVAVVLGNRHIQKAQFYSIELMRPRDHSDLAVSLIGQSHRAFEKLVRAGHTFVHQPEEPEHGEVALRFLDATRVELMGVESHEGQLIMELETGSTLTLTPPRQERKAAPLKTAMAGNSPARLVRDEKHGAMIVFGHGLMSGVDIALRPHQIVRAILRFTVGKAARPGEQIHLHLRQRDHDGCIVGGVTVQVNVPKRNANECTDGAA